jgi:hypothetical protein
MTNALKRATKSPCRTMRILLLAVSGIVAMNVTCAADDPAIYQPAVQAGVSELNLWIRMPNAEKVAFSGAVNYDKPAGNGAGMLYPAPNLIGMLAAVATHAALATSANESKKQGLRTEADKVLVPYQSVLDDYKNQELFQLSIGKMATTGSKKIVSSNDQANTGAVVVETTSMFSMTQDQKALILDNVISIKKSNAATPYQVAVHVVSSAKDSADLNNFWNENKGYKLKEESSLLFAHSLDIALADQLNIAKNANPFKTIRYVEGGAEKIERGQPISDHCHQLLFRNLRGNLMLVPLKNEGAPEETSTCMDTHETAMQVSN